MRAVVPVSHARGKAFVCDTIAALPELIHHCQNQHMLLSYTVILRVSKLLPLNVFVGDEGSVR